jgi:hypothetical protein
METKFKGAFREFTAETLFSPEVQIPTPKIIWRTHIDVTDGLADQTNEEIINISERGLNIISSRDVRKNVRKSLEIAVDLAASGLRVLYINSYASLGTLRDGLKEQLERYPDLMQNSGEGAPKIDLPLRFLDCKMGMWELCRRTIDESMDKVEYVVITSGSVSWSEEKVTQSVDVLIVNSFEFSAVEYRPRMVVASDLTEWRDKRELTVILFTQEVRAVMEAGLPVRGPLGLLTATATTLSKVDKVVWSRNLPKNANSGKTREKDKQISKTAIKIFYSGDGQIAGVEYPKGYNGKRYDLGFFPRTVMDDVPDGIEAVQLVGMPPMDDKSVGYTSRGNWEHP